MQKSFFKIILFILTFDTNAPFFIKQGWPHWKKWFICFYIYNPGQVRLKSCLNRHSISYVLDAFHCWCCRYNCDDIKIFANLEKVFWILRLKTYINLTGVFANCWLVSILRGKQYITQKYLSSSEINLK